MSPLSLRGFSRLIMTAFAASPPESVPDHTMDPLNSTSYGAMVSRDRMVLKVDCPGCPVYNSSWDTEATALIFDFTVSKKNANLTEPQPPIIQLNNKTFYPPGNQLGFTPFTAHVALPVPWNTTLDAYMDQPQQYTPADLVATVDGLPVVNTHGWNLTRVTLTTFAYGTTKENEFENRGGNLSAIDLFFRRLSLVKDSVPPGTDIASKTGLSEWWMLQWWQIVPMEEIFTNRDRFTNSNMTSAPLPDGLRDHILGNGTEWGDGHDREGASGSRNVGKILLAIGLALIVAGLVGVLIYYSYRVWQRRAGRSAIRLPERSGERRVGPEEEALLEDREVDEEPSHSDSRAQ